MVAKIHTALTVLWLLSLAILGTIYLAWALYPLENHWMGLADTVYMSDRTLYYNFNHLMQYLTLPWVTKLSMPDFRSSLDGLHHFRDVKHLFHLAQAVFILTTWPGLTFFKKHWQQDSLWLFRRLWFGLALLPIIIGLFGSLIGFDQFFTMFHQVLFPGASNWLFNPYTDPIIWVLPEAYFFHCFMIFLAFYELLMLGIWLASHRTYQRYKIKTAP